MIDDYFGRLAARIAGDPGLRLVRPVSREILRPEAEQSEDSGELRFKALPAPADEGTSEGDITGEDASS